MSAQFYTGRHAEAYSIPGTFYVGDPPLTERGRSEAAQLGRFTAGLNIGLILCSPPQRTAETAAYVARYHPSAEIIYDERAAEQNWGPVAGKKKSAVFTEEVHARAQHEGLAFRVHPHAENELEVAARMLSLIQEYSGFTDGDVYIQTHHVPAVALPAAVQNVSRADFRRCSVPTASIAPLDVYEPALRIPIFAPAV